MDAKAKGDLVVMGGDFNTYHPGQGSDMSKKSRSNHQVADGRHLFKAMKAQSMECLKHGQADALV